MMSFQDFIVQLFFIENTSFFIEIISFFIEITSIFHLENSVSDH